MKTTCIRHSLLHIFSWNWYNLSFKCLFFSSIAAGKHVIVKQGIGSWWQIISLPQCQKNKLVHFLFIITGLFVITWFFWNKKDAISFFLGSHLTVQFHLFRVIIGVAVNTHRTLSPDIFCYGIIQCVLGVSLHNFEKPGNALLWTWELDPYGKSTFSKFGLWIIAASILPEKHTGYLFPSLLEQLWSWFWVFWKKQAVWNFFLGCKLTSISRN